MAKLSIDNLIIEITRRCNMACAHCLRGDAQNIDIDPSYMLKLLRDNNIDYISMVTFTGGEPTLT